MFKAGDKVVCVDQPTHEDGIYLGGIYTFKCMREDFPHECWIEENDSSWSMSRFKLYEEPQQPNKSFQSGDSLRCIDNQGCEGLLNIGEIYECKGMRSTSLVDVELGRTDNYGWGRPTAFDVKRFEKVVFEEAKYRETTTRYKVDMTGIEKDFEHITPEQDIFLKQHIAEQVEEALSWEDVSACQVEDPVKESEPEYTGSSVSYYKVFVKNPTTEGVEPYFVECNDVIEALDMDFAQGNIQKALFRMSVAKKFGLKKKGYEDAKYDIEKIIFFANRLLANLDKN